MRLMIWLPLCTLGCSELLATLEAPPQTQAASAEAVEAPGTAEVEATTDGEAAGNAASKAAETNAGPTERAEVAPRPEVWPPVTVPQGARPGTGTSFPGLKRKTGRVIDLGDGESFDPNVEY